MADEYIRLDTTIMGIDGLINEAPTGSQARALLCAKDMIYDEQRYVSEMKPVKRGRWIEHNDWIECNVCEFEVNDGYYEKRDMASTETRYTYCPRCGARMDGEVE